MEQNLSLPDTIVHVYTQLGFADLVGGPDALAKGIDDLQTELIPVVGELALAAKTNVPFAKAVSDTERFPHLTRIHGFIRDIDVFQMPDELLAWAGRVVRMGPMPDASRLLHRIVATFLRGESSGERLLARFAIFEFLCLGQRWLLRSAEVHLEPLGDTRHRVEILAEQELVEAEKREPYAEELLALEDPFKVLTAANITSMGMHLSVLRKSLNEISTDLNRRIEVRARLLEVMETFPPQDAVLIRNGAAEVFDEQQLAPEQLRLLHPLLLGSVGDDAIYKRTSRLRDRVAKKWREPERDEPSSRIPAAADKSISGLMLKALKERA